MASALRLVVGADIGGGRTHHHHGAGTPGQGQGGVPRVIQGRVFNLFIRWLVLLVHDDDAGIGDRSEHCAAGSHHHVCLAVPDAPPLVEPLPVGQPMVENRGAAWETDR